MLSEQQIWEYIKKINCESNTECSLSNLRMLQYRHLLTIPYENLDPMNGVALSLSPDDLFEKIILNSRGGYCFELQGLFYYLLQSLGYQVTQYAGRFMNEPWHVQMRRHRILVANIAGNRYVCDVGVRSESPRYPLILEEDTVQTDGICEYRYEKDSFYGWILMQKQPNKEWKPMLGFTEEPQIDEDFIMPSFYCEKHPDSTFNKFMKISIFTDDTNLNIIGNEFRVFKNGRIISRHTIENDRAAREYLSEKFGIKAPGSYRFIK
ncbi:MAG: arylamine N-acetyltransferase [Eubacteriaceae bacterium]|nr:arylamine N-acetyltransferase [Eubacteriaceae bacterium]